MKRTENSNIVYSGNLIAKNTVYNLFGYGIPLIFAIALIPPLISGLGVERFGILNLAWIIIGYFSFLDFGIGRAVTKIIAEKIGTDESDKIPGIFWTSIFLMLIASLIGGILVYLLTPSLVMDIFKISGEIQDETTKAFYLLAFSIPIVTTTAGLRGVLEAYQKFGIINIIRTSLGVSSFLVPLICLIFTNSLYWIVFFLMLIRILIWCLYLIQCFRLNNNLKEDINFSLHNIKPILKLSGWITVSNIVVPLMIYLDRFLIGVIDSATAITYYATPYEVVSKLLLIPSALTGVLFPAISANYQSNPDFTRNMTNKSVKYIFFLLFPLVLVIVSFAYEGMYVWIGEKFAVNSALILQLLAIGVLFNSMAYIPFSYLQGVGRPDITAKIQLAELPFYVVFMWFAIDEFGIKGAALVWTLRIIVDSFLLFWFERKVSSIRIRITFTFKHWFLVIIVIISLLPLFISSLYIRLFIVIIILLVFAQIFWKYFLDIDERNFLINKLKKVKS